MQVFSFIYSIILVVVGFGILIFVHELGHFIAAKLMGVRAEMFALGFGRKIFAFKRGETEYSIRWIPLGGFVKLAGISDLADEKPTGAPYEFQSKPAWRRAIIIAAGVFMNLVFALLVLSLMFLCGKDFTSPVIGDVMAESAAQEAGLQAGDIIKEINGRKISTFDKLQVEVALNGNNPMDVAYERDGKIYRTKISPKYDDAKGFSMIGIAPALSNKIAGIENTQFQTKFGLENGDEIIGIDGIEISEDKSDIIRNFMGNNPGKTVKMKVRRDGNILDKEVTIPVQKHWTCGFITDWELKIKSTMKGMPAYEKMQPGEYITAINGNKIYTTQEISKAIFERDGKPVKFTVTGEQGSRDVEIQPVVSPGSNIYRIGIYYSLPPEDEETPIVIREIIPGSPAEKAKLQPGDKILNYTAIIQNLNTLVTQTFLSETAPEPTPIEIKYKRGDTESTVEMTPFVYENAANGIGLPTVPRKVTIKASGTYGLDNVYNAVALSCSESYDMVIKTYLFISKLFSRDVSAKTVAGPVGVLHITYKAAESGMGTFIYILAMISLNLAIVNFLPLPVLDGGLILFIGIEKLKGSPVSEKVMGYVTYAGLAMLGLLVLFATFNDINRFFQ